MTSEEKAKVIEHAKRQLSTNRRTNILEIISNLNILRYETADAEAIIYELLTQDGVIRTNWELIIDPKHKPKTERDREIEDLNFKKLILDVKNAERVHKSYRTTRIFAWFGFIAGLFLLLLKLAEVLKWWPYHK